MSVTLLVVNINIVLVRPLYEVDSGVSNSEARETIKIWKMFKVSSKACFIREQVGQVGHWPLADVFRL